MVSLRRVLVILVILLVPLCVLGLALTTASAALPAPEDGSRQAVAPNLNQAGRADRWLPSLADLQDDLPGPTAEPLTTLSVTILSSPWATLDSNNWDDPDGPNVFVVQAFVTNTGLVTASDLTVALDYGIDEPAGWVLVDGEEPLRSVTELPPRQGQHLYWLARYPATLATTSHRYTVTAVADNAPSVATADNVYGNPAPDMTVETLHAVSAGNSGIVSHVTSDIVVGVPFTISVVYDLGTNPDVVMFSPVGNPDFAAGAFRLVSSSVYLYNDAVTQQQVYPDQLYFPSLPAFAENAEVTYTWLALLGETTRLCSYADIGSGPTFKYDISYCTDPSTVYVAGTVDVQLDKYVNASTVEQGETLTYTIRYTNTGTWALADVWIWDELDPAAGSVITESIVPPTYDRDELEANRLAWYIGDLAVGDGGTFSYALHVDGGGYDLADGTEIVNHAHYGISAGNLYSKPALTATVTTTVQAPAVTVSKTDGRSIAQAGERITYTLMVTNDGSIPATGVVITDVLPGYLVLDGPTTPITDSQDGQTLVWTGRGPIPPAGGQLTISVPCRVLDQAPDGVVLSNVMTVTYGNGVGYRYDPAEAQDTTTVEAPILEITKSAWPDPVGNGMPLTYTVRYTNTGPMDASGAVVTDRVPVSTTFVSCAGGQSCQESDGVVTWLLGAVPSGAANPPLQLVVRTDDGLHTGELVVNGEYGIRSDQTPAVSGAPVVVSVLRRAAVIEGHAFVDADGDGLRDAGEPGLAGVTVTLPTALVPSTLTDGDGYYAFSVETTGPALLEAGLPAGYFRTTPGDVWLEPLLDMTQTVDFGYAHGDEFGVIYGTVFDDRNYDGQQGAGESGLAGVTVTSAEAITPTVTTNQLGQYTLSFDVSGPVTVTETNPPLYVSTTPDQVQSDVAPGSSGSSPVDFGDAMPADLALSKQGWPDPVSAGGSLTYTVEVTNLGPADASGVVVTDTLPVSLTLIAHELSQGDLDGATGVWHVGDLAPGANATMTLVTQVDPDALGSLVNSATVAARTLDPQAGNNTAETSTAIAAWADLTVAKAARPDPVAAGGTLTFTLSFANDGPSTAQSVAITDTLGTGLVFGGLVAVEPAEFDFSTAGDLLTWGGPGLAPGSGGTIVYTATVRPDAGETVSNGVVIGSSTPDGNQGNNTDLALIQVGRPDAATIYGWVFEDRDGDGLFDPDEPGIADVLVTLDGQASTTTDSDGLYAFLVDTGGVHVVTETDPAGHYSTTPNQVHVAVLLGTVYRVDFGDALVISDEASIFGTVFDDLDGDGAWDPDEVGIPGVTLTLQGDVATTDAYGSYTFAIPAAGEYTVEETDPDGYISTTPNAVTVTVELGFGYQVDFGDMLSPACSCPPDGFEDDDDWTDAAPLGLGQPQTHDFCDDSADWSSFVAEAGSIYTLTTYAWGQRADTFLTLFDVDGASVLATNDDYEGAVDYSSQIVWEAPAGGTYYLRTTNRAGLNGCHTDYDLWLDGQDRHALYLPLIARDYRGETSASLNGGTPDGVINHACPDAYEVDDTWEIAQPLVDGQVQVHSFDSDPALYAADKDWLGFDLRSRQTITMSILQVTNTVTLLELFDAEGGLLAQTEATQLVWQAPADGHYFVAVSPLTTTFGCADTAGYRLVGTRASLNRLFLPLVLR